VSKRAEVAKREEVEPLDVRLGEVDLSDHVACAQLLDEVRTLEGQLAGAKRLLTQAIVERAREEGVTSFDVPGRMKVEIRAGTRTTYSPEVLEERLRRAGMSDERIAEIVVPTVSHSVKATEAKKAAKMNPAYAAALEAASDTHEVSPSVTIRRR
jgi:hypothetical protein